MVRIATIPLQRTLFDAIGQSQLRLAEAQQQMASGKKATTLSALGSEAVRTLSARSLLARQQSEAVVANRLKSTLALVDSHLTAADDSLGSLKTQLLKGIGEGRTDGLQGIIDEAFQTFRVAMNADEGGAPLFGGAQVDLPFKPATLADTIGMATSAAFTNDQVKSTARVADGLDVRVGIVASDIGSDVFEAFRTLAEAGTIGTVPTAAQSAALQTAAAKLDSGIKQLRAQSSENGRRQAQVDTLADRASERSTILQDLISKNEDADMAEVASELTLRQTALQASYSVFAKLSGLSLVNYLR